MVPGIFFTKVQTPCQRHRVCIFVSSKLKTLRYGFQYCHNCFRYSQLCSVIGLKHLQHLLICNKSDTKSKTNCSYVRIFSSKFHQFIGPIYTGDGSSVWDKLWQRTIARLIIRLCINTDKHTDHPSGRVIHDGSSHKTNYRDS